MKKVISLIVLILSISNAYGIDSLLLSLKQRDYKKIDSISRSYKTVEEAIDGISKFEFDADKARGVFNFVCEFMTYEDYDNWVERQSKPSISVEITLKTKKGVCYDYAVLYDYICSKVGLECVVISGVDKSTNPHAWNVVTIDGKLYILDVTLADYTDMYTTFNGGIRYNTYLIPPECAIGYYFPVVYYDGDIRYGNKVAKSNVYDLKNFDNYYLANKKSIDKQTIEASKYQCLEKPLTIYGFMHSKYLGDDRHDNKKPIYHYYKEHVSDEFIKSIKPKNDPNMYINLDYIK